MKFLTENKISEDLGNYFNEVTNFEPPKGLEEDNYATPFDGFNDLHLFRALAINRPELTSDYTSLLDKESFYET